MRISASGTGMPDLLDGDASAFGILRQNGGTLTVVRTASSVQFIVSFRASTQPPAGNPSRHALFTDAGDPTPAVHAGGSDVRLASKVLR